MPKQKKAGNRKVSDRKGTDYTLTGRIGEGGQGTVCSTDRPGVLVKIAGQGKSDAEKREWTRHIEWLMRQPLEGLNLARPLEVIARPERVNGYVMELMDGLESLQKSFQSSIQLFRENEEDRLEGYRITGGLKRRLLLLQQLAYTLADLHARGMAYGDLSPNNVYISQSVEHHQLWLIDCDNICVSERAGHNHVHTPGYGAPELIREETGVNMSTDCWSFAVMAFHLLTHCHPYYAGVAVEDEEPETGMLRADRGELPWIFDSSDDSNAWTEEDGIPYELVTTKRLRHLFNRCFSDGLQNISERPCMSAWADALDEAISLLHNCNNEECGIAFVMNRERRCAFCDTIHPAEATLLLQHWLFIEESKTDDEQWIKTPSFQVLNFDQPIDFHLAPRGTELYRESPKLCTVELKADGLWITPAPDGFVELKRIRDDITQHLTRRQKLKAESRKGDEFHLILRHKSGEGYQSHPIWKFNW